MKTQTKIELYTSGTRVVAKIVAPPGHSSRPPYVTAKAAANQYASHSSWDWWEATVNMPWRNSITRYDRLDSYRIRLQRRIEKLLKAKGLK